MVYVSVDSVAVRRNSFFIDLTVMGFNPPGCIEAVDFLTSVFERMRFNYIYAKFPLSKLGYYIEELSRRKIYLAVAPMNTYHWTPNWSPPDCLADAKRCDPDTELPICVFADVGSPLRHIYVAHQSTVRREEGVTYSVRGVGVIELSEGEVLTVYADFHEWAPACTASWCKDYLKAIEGKIESKEIHIGVYPAPVDERHRSRLRLIEKALKLAGLT
jgi:hypothetical protein